MFNPVIPEIAKAFENDPRTRIAQTLMQSGANTSPVATGKWAWADGLARALSGVAGGYIQKRNQKKYEEREDKYQEDLQAAIDGVMNPQGQGLVQNGELGPETPINDIAAALTGVPQQNSPLANVATGQPSMQEIRSAIRPSTGPLQTIDPNLALEAPQTPPTGMGSPPPLSPPPQMAAMPPAPPPQMPQQPAAAQPVSTLPTYNPAMSVNPELKKIRNYYEPFKSFGSAQVSSGYGVQRGNETHNGVDVPLPKGTPIQAPFSGTAYIKENKRGGKQVILRMDDGARFGVAHLDGYNIKDGQRVEAGSVLGFSGNTGRVRGKNGGYHGHFTYVGSDGVRRDPMVALKGAVGAPAAEGQQGEGVNIAAAQIPQPPVVMEQAPTLDAAILTPPKPQVMQVPDAVQSKRLGIAQRLMQSGNKDLMAIAQGYLNEGLGEQFQADNQRNQQQFDVGLKGYGTELTDYSDSRSGARDNFYQSGRDVKTRNFERERGEDQQAFDAQSQANSFANEQQMQQAGFAHDKSMAEFNRDAAMDMAKYQNSEEWRRMERGIEAQAGTSADKAAAKISAFYNTPTGAKLFDKMQTELQNANGMLADLQRMSQLADQVPSAGIMGIPYMDTIIASAGNEDVAEFNALTSKFTLDKIGGSLGAQISNSDRDFVLRMAPSVKLPAEANRRIIAARMAVVQRSIEYQNGLMEAIPQGTQQQFISEWQAYVNANSLQKAFGGNGKMGKYVSFAEWKNSRAKFDANGNRIN